MQSLPLSVYPALYIHSHTYTCAATSLFFMHTCYDVYNYKHINMIVRMTLTRTHNSWIDSYMDELPSSESPESSQPEPGTEVPQLPAVADPEPPEPYIMFEKPKAGVIPSPPHQPVESGGSSSSSRCPPAGSQTKNEDDDAKSDSYYSDRYV